MKIKDLLLQDQRKRPYQGLIYLSRDTIVSDDVDGVDEDALRSLEPGEEVAIERHTRGIEEDVLADVMAPNGAPARLVADGYFV